MSNQSVHLRSRQSRGTVSRPASTNTRHVFVVVLIAAAFGSGLSFAEQWPNHPSPTKGSEVASYARSIGLRPSVSACIKSAGGATPGTRDCLRDEHDFQDHRLNQTYKKLMGSLVEVDRKHLREEERQWITFRDKYCAVGNEPGQGQELDADECVVDQTADRATELESRMASESRRHLTTTVPDDVRALVAPTDTLLAYKATDLYGDGQQAAVVVVRHPIHGKTDYDFNNNPCDLVVLRRQAGKLSEADHSTKVVDCTYNDIARHAPAMSLSDNLSVSPAHIVYVNQKDRGYSTFYFAWSEQKSMWYLQRATTSNPDGDRVANAGASYPADFAWTPMSSVEPDAMAKILQKQHGTSSE